MAAKFTISKRGYDMREVDNYIEKLELSLKEYKEKEDAISKALINAESMSQHTIESAKEKLKDIMADAFTRFHEEIEAVEKMITGEKRVLEDFCAEYDLIVKNYFTGSAHDVTAPLREKINLIESIVKEARSHKPASLFEADDTTEGIGNEIENR